MQVNINLLKDLKPKKSILICGLPGIAYVGKLSVDYLMRELKAELIGEIYSQFFSPYVLIKNDGVVELLKNELYHSKNKTENIFFFTGNAQATSPEGQYIIAEKVLDAAIKLGVKRIYSIAAFLNSKPFKTPQVYGSATNLSLVKTIKRYGVVPMVEGSISGANGLIFGLASVKKLEGICLLGETRGYRTVTGQYFVDAKAVMAVLEVLTRLLDLEIDMAPLDKQAEQIDELIAKMVMIEKHMQQEVRETTDKGRTYYIS